MMVETILETSQDFGMSNGALPQWKRELLQRRAARSRPPAGAAACPAPPPPPPPPLPAPLDEDEELRYGPGIVKRLKSRYLSLALRDAPRRRPSVLRRAASLEHLLDERPPPAPRARAPRPASLAAASAPAPDLRRLPARRDSVKRARSVDALSRLDSRDPSPPPAPAPAPAPRPPALRAARVPRRVQPLLRETERPPPDVVRSTLRKFESAPARRPVPAARLSAGAVLRRSPTPERGPETPQPPAPPAAEPEQPTIATPKSVEAPKIIDVPEIVTAPQIVDNYVTGRSDAEADADEVEGSAASRLVSRAALDEIARAGSSVRYAFPLSATNPVLAAATRPLRRVGVIRPMPPARPEPAAAAAADPPTDLKDETRLPTSPAAAERETTPPLVALRPRPAAADSPERECAVLVNGHSTPEPGALSRIGAAGIERAWSGSAVKNIDAAPTWLRSGVGVGGGRGRAPPAAAAATSVVFNFSNRKEVPDYIENDGIILRASRRNRIKAGEAGVVVLRPEALSADEDEDAVGEEEPPSPCDVRFVNDNVLINGRSSMPCKPNKDRIAKLKLQFDDSLTRTFEYPSETSLCECECEESSPAPATASALADNTHMASAALSHYTPRTCAAAFQLGLTNPHQPPAPAPQAPVNGSGSPDADADADADVSLEEGAGDGGGGEVRGCGADVARSWSEARAKRTDLLF